MYLIQWASSPMTFGRPIGCVCDFCQPAIIHSAYTISSCSSPDSGPFYGISNVSCEFSPAECRGVMQHFKFPRKEKIFSSSSSFWRTVYFIHCDVQLSHQRLTVQET